MRMNGPWLVEWMDRWPRDGRAEREVREVISWKPLSNQIMWSEVSYLIIRRWGRPARHGQGTGSDSPYCALHSLASDKRKKVIVPY